MLILNSLLLRRSRRRNEYSKTDQEETELSSGHSEMPQLTVLPEAVPNQIPASPQEQTVQNQIPASQQESVTPAWRELFSVSQQNRSSEPTAENSAEEPQILQILEKICTTLEQIAENTESCLRKMDSDDDLKFN